MKFMAKAQRALASKAGETYIDTGVKILIAVVVGAIVLALLIFLIRDIVKPSAESKVSSMFDVKETFSK